MSSRLHKHSQKRISLAQRFNFFQAAFYHSSSSHRVCLNRVVVGPRRVPPERLLARQARRILICYPNQRIVGYHRPGKNFSLSRLLCRLSMQAFEWLLKKSSRRQQSVMNNIKLTRCYNSDVSG